MENYHLIKPDNDEKQAILNYNEGLYNDANIIRVHDYDTEKLKLKFVKYLLVTRGYTKILSGESFLKGVVALPETLYIFELLQKGRFDYLDCIDISKIMDLFKFSYDLVNQISLGGLEKLGCYGVENGVNDKLFDKIQETQKVIKIAREQGRTR